MIDLHLHSTFSDGSEEPEALVALGAAAGLTAMALTDHDSLRGTERFATAARAVGIQVLAGVELSVEHAGGELHMLGYGIDPDHAELQSRLTELRGGREVRNLRILERLGTLGCPLEYDAVAALAGDGEVVGRPHIAAALAEAGFVRDKQEAFTRYLSYGAAAYCERFRMTPEAAVRLIRAAGGLPVLAHPHLLGLRRGPLHALVAGLAKLGLAGVEVYHSEQGAAATAALHRLALDLGLVATGGSDFHGAFNPEIRVGVGFGGLRVPDECFAALRSRLPAGVDGSGVSC